MFMELSTGFVIFKQGLYLPVVTSDDPINSI